MQIVDTALKRAIEEGNPIRVGIVGMGWSGSRILYQLTHFVPGICVVAIANRTMQRALDALQQAGIDDYSTPGNAREVNIGVAAGRLVAVEDPFLICQADEIDVIVESTGTVDHAAEVVYQAIQHGKHVIALNAELDATLGPILAKHAREAGVIYSNTDGDEPGVAMNLIRMVRSMGLKPVLAGNLKGLYDPYRTPETQAEFAAKLGQKPTSMTHFADGTKLSMELTVLANAAGWGIIERGMKGPQLSHVNEAAEYFAPYAVPSATTTGVVDYLVGAAPYTGAFVLGYTEDHFHKEYLEYLKLGDGPLYVFYTPFHLPQLEVANTIARAKLFGDATVTPCGPPRCDTVAIAKQDLPIGTVLDGMGGFHTYGLIEDYGIARTSQFVPIGMSAGRVVLTNIEKDVPIREGDLSPLGNNLIARLSQEQDRWFHSAI